MVFGPTMETRAMAEIMTTTAAAKSATQKMMLPPYKGWCPCGTGGTIKVPRRIEVTYIWISQTHNGATLDQ